jgi:hypothetical protein
LLNSKFGSYIEAYTSFKRCITETEEDCHFFVPFTLFFKASEDDRKDVEVSKKDTINILIAAYFQGFWAAVANIICEKISASQKELCLSIDYY